AYSHSRTDRFAQFGWREHAFLQLLWWHGIRLSEHDQRAICQCSRWERKFGTRYQFNRVWQHLAKDSKYEFLCADSIRTTDRRGKISHREVSAGSPPTGAQLLSLGCGPLTVNNIPSSRC